MRILWLAGVLVSVSVGCTHADPGDLGAPPSAAECEHVWGQPSGYMASACCRTQADCAAADQAQYACTAPGTPLPSGACVPLDCNVDADCRAGGSPTAICQPVPSTPCSQPDWSGLCAAGCTDSAACAEGEACDLATNRCHAAGCATAADCPADFACDGGACAREACATDADCDGYCVTGHCYSSAGECRGPVG